MARFCFDLDGTICHTRKMDQAYIDVKPIDGMVDLIRRLYDAGHYIIIYTARNMETHNGNIGKITAIQVPIITEWLHKWDIPFDELYVGKPLADYYIDDKGVTFTDISTLTRDLGLDE